MIVFSQTNGEKRKSSFIRTVPSALESHQIGCAKAVRGLKAVKRDRNTAGGDFRPAPKTAIIKFIAVKVPKFYYFARARSSQIEPISIAL